MERKDSNGIGDGGEGGFSSLITISPPSSSDGRPQAHNEKTQLISSKASPNKQFSWLIFGKNDDEDDLFEEEDFESSSLAGRTLGTFTGVFAPVSLGIFSSLLFLRIGYILGNAGFLVTLLQFFIAYVILISTIASISALSSNGAVEGGGVYFMLSRTMGPEIGGAIGTLFFFANVVSSALYLAGCTEGLMANFKFLIKGPWIEFLYSSTINLLSLFICLVGSKFFGKTSMLIFMSVLACVLLTSASFFLDAQVKEDFVFNATDPLKCVQPPPNATDKTPNCTLSAVGTFTGIGHWNETLIRNNFIENLYPKYEFDCSGADSSLSFFVIFGVLFSGVTGIMSGANMCGELKSPSKSIPRGTMSACLFTFFVYILLTVLTALTCSPSLLLHNCMYLNLVNVLPSSVAIGVFMATFSASLTNLIGASRILEAVAKDVVFGPLFNFVIKGTFKENPVVAVICTWFFVELFLMMGSLNNIAQLCSVLFLLSYAVINLTCLFLHLASAPNFRPTYKYFSTYTCLTGLLGCVIMMFAVSAIYSAVGILLCLSLILLLNLFSPIRHTNWGSISQALIFHQVRKYLLLLDQRKSHVKFWRPQMLLLVSNPRTNCSLIEFGNALKKSGLYVLGHVLVDALGEHEKDPTLNEIPQWLKIVDFLRVKAFVEITIAKTLREGIEQLVRISGIGAMKPNTVLLGFKDDTFPRDDFKNPVSPYVTHEFDNLFPIPSDDDNGLTSEEYVGIILDILKQDKNLCLCRHFQKLNTTDMFRPKKESIFGTTVKAKMYLDVWIIDFFSKSPHLTDISDSTSLLLLQLACIVNMVNRWKRLKIRVFIAVDSKDNSSKKKQVKLSELLEMLRIEAMAKILSWEEPRCFRDESAEDSFGEYLQICRDTVRKRSDQTAVTFLYMPDVPQESQKFSQYHENLKNLTDQWPPTLIVRGLAPVTSTTLQ